VIGWLAGEPIYESKIPEVYRPWPVMINYLNIEMPSFRASSSQEVSYLIIGAVHAQACPDCPALPSFSGGRGCPEHLAAPEVGTPAGGWVGLIRRQEPLKLSCFTSKPWRGHRITLLATERSQLDYSKLLYLCFQMGIK